jgi:hypothetical protein
MVFYGGKNRRYVGYFTLSSREFSSFIQFFLLLLSSRSGCQYTEFAP